MKAVVICAVSLAGLVLTGCGKPSGSKGICLEVSSVDDRRLEAAAVQYLKENTEWKVQGRNGGEKACEANTWMTVTAISVDNNFGYTVGHSIAVAMNDPSKTPFPTVVTAYWSGNLGSGLANALKIAQELHARDTAGTISRRK